MVSVARKNLFEEKSRFLISVSGLAFAVMLIIMGAGFVDGQLIASTAYPEKTEVDIWVGQKGATVTGLASILPASLEAGIGEVEGVREVHPIITSRFAVRVGDGEAPVILVGYDPDSNVGGPWKIAEGASKLDRGQAIIDKTFAKVFGFSVGDSLEILEEEFTVVGLSDETNLWWQQYIFLDIEDLSDLLQLQEAASYFLVSVADPSRTEAVADGISNALDVTAFTREVVIGAYIDQAQTGAEIVYVMYVIGFIVGTAMIGVTVLTLTFEKIKEYAVLRAIGASNRQVYRIVFGQSLIIAVFGFLAGALVYAVFLIVLESLMPQVLVTVLPESIPPIFLLTLGMTLFSSYIPIRRIAKADPAGVFRA